MHHGEGPATPRPTCALHAQTPARMRAITHTPRAHKLTYTRGHGHRPDLKIVNLLHFVQVAIAYKPINIARF